MPGTYYTDFKTYLNHTDEKPVLVAGLQKIIKSRGINSIIDIGAGNGGS